MREFLIKLLNIGHKDPTRVAMVTEHINEAKEEYIKLAYKAALDKSSNAKIIYLLGGNDPAKCPFA